MIRRKPKTLFCLVLCVALLIFASKSREYDTETEPQAPSGTQSMASVVNENFHMFRSEKLLVTHFEKHGAEFGDITMDEYVRLANVLITSPTALQKTEKEDGDAVYYEEADNTFLVLSKDGYIRTFFHPSGGLDYYNRQ